MTEEQIDDFFDGLVKDNRELYWTRKAERGEFEALMRLGIIYYNGFEGINRNEEKAVRLWEKAASLKDDAELFYYLGFAYDRTLEEYKTAAYWYKKAINQGHNYSKTCLNSIKRHLK